MNRLIGYFVIFITIYATIVTPQSCDEEENCPNIPDGEIEWNLTLLPVPSDCSKFIICQRGLKHFMNCPGSLHFNNDFKYCDYPEEAGCEECDTTGTTEVDYDETTTEVPGEVTPTLVDEWEEC